MSESIGNTVKGAKRIYSNPHKAEQCRAIVWEITESYLDREPVANSGQLKFLKNLMIRHLAFSTNALVRHKEAKMKDFIKKNILGGSSQEVVDLFDQETDLLAFADSVYCEVHAFLNKENVKERGLFKQRDYNIPFPSYLLLQKIKEKVVQSMEIYMISVKKLEAAKDEEGEKERKTEEEKNAADQRIAEVQKNAEEDYRDFLIAIAFYEITLKELNANLNHELKNCKLRLERLENHEEAIKVFSEKTNFTEEEAQSGLEELELGMCSIIESETVFLALRYFLFEMKAYYALLRIVSVIEWVNINYHTYSKKEESRHKEAELWDQFIKECMNGGCLFTSPDRKKNLLKWCREFVGFYEKFFPTLDRNKEQFEESKVSVGTMTARYLEISKGIMAKRREMNTLLTKKGSKKDARRDEKLEEMKKELWKMEKELWRVEEELAKPIWKVLEHLPEVKEE